MVRAGAQGELDVHRDAVAWVCEQHDDDVFAISTGMFSAHVERGDGLEVAADLLPIADAVAWARERAPRVIVRVDCGADGTHYTAGQVPIDWGAEEDGTPRMIPYPVAGLTVARRRTPGWEHLDRTPEDSAIRWDVLVYGGRRSVPHNLAEPFQQTLSSTSAEIVDIELGDLTRRAQSREYPPVQVVVRVEACTVDGAETRAVELVAGAVVIAKRENVPLEGPMPKWRARAVPTDSPLASRIARISRRV